jgi:hypothetical protein
VSPASSLNWNISQVLSSRLPRPQTSPERPTLTDAAANQDRKRKAEDEGNEQPGKLPAIAMRSSVTTNRPILRSSVRTGQPPSKLVSRGVPPLGTVANGATKGTRATSVPARKVSGTVSLRKTTPDPGMAASTLGKPRTVSGTRLATIPAGVRRLSRYRLSDILSFFLG